MSNVINVTHTGFPVNVKTVCVDLQLNQVTSGLQLVYLINNQEQFVVNTMMIDLNLHILYVNPNKHKKKNECVSAGYLWKIWNAIIPLGFGQSAGSMDPQLGYTV